MPSTPANWGNSASDTISALARLSESMYSKSFGVSRVFTAIGTIPALMAPRNAVGKSIVSVSARSTRCSMSRPSDLKPEPKRLTRSASWPKVYCPASSM